MGGKLHGYSQTKTYSVWKGMINRCTKKKNKDYRWYGGKGISVCDRWSKFENFISDMGMAPDGYEIDRINSDGDYCKENCRWLTRSDNQANKRSKKKTGDLRGVYRGSKNSYAARIGFNNKIITIGNYKTQREAHEAYREYFYKLRGFYPPD